MSAKRPAEEEPVNENDLWNFVCLGGGSEVGRSCHIFTYKGKTVMVRLFTTNRDYKSTFSINHD